MATKCRLSRVQTTCVRVLDKLLKIVRKEEKEMSDLHVVHQLALDVYDAEKRKKTGMRVSPMFVAKCMICGVERHSAGTGPIKCLKCGQMNCGPAQWGLRKISNLKEAIKAIMTPPPPRYWTSHPNHICRDQGRQSDRFAS